MTASAELQSAEPFCVPGRLELIPEAPHSGAIRTHELEQSVFARSSLMPAQPSRALTPTPAALKDLVQTLAVVGELHAALRVYAVVSLLATCQCHYAAMMLVSYNSCSQAHPLDHGANLFLKPLHRSGIVCMLCVLAAIAWREHG